MEWKSFNETRYSLKNATSELVFLYKDKSYIRDYQAFSST